MTECSIDAPRRDRKPSANQTVRTSISHAFRRFWRRVIDREEGRPLRHLSDHLARDIGLGPNDMARHRHVWPSESTDRPRI